MARGKGSRVYVEIKDGGAQVKLIFKNISAAELVKRFIQGDEARSSSGSGLGLFIVQSLLELQKGSLDVKIDGDLFKVILIIPKVG